MRDSDGENVWEIYEFNGTNVQDFPFLRSRRWSEAANLTAGAGSGNARSVWLSSRLEGRLRGTHLVRVANEKTAGADDFRAGGAGLGSVPALRAHR